MTRFRCPTRSLSSTGSKGNVAVNAKVRATRRPVARVETVEEIEAGGNESNHQPSPQPAPPTLPNKKGKGKARATVKATAPRREEELRANIKNAMAQVKANRTQWSFVYVGNLSSSIETEHLWKHFSGCGPIVHIEIRASMGICVPTANLPKPSWGMGAPLEGTHYATMHFTTPDGARKAFDLGGSILLDRKIIVTFNAIDLPETIGIVKEHLRKKEPQNDKRSFWLNKYRQFKRLTIEKTEYISEQPTKSNGGAQLVAGLAKRVGGCAAGGSTAAGDQNRHGHALQRPLAFAEQITFPQTLI